MKCPIFVCRLFAKIDKNVLTCHFKCIYLADLFVIFEGSRYHKIINGSLQKMIIK